MSLATIPVGRRGVTPCYCRTFRQAVDDLLPVGAVPAGWGAAAGKRWTDRQVVVCGLLMGWDDGRTAKDRFAAARRCAVEMHPGRRRPGASYDGCAGALGAVHGHVPAGLPGVADFGGHGSTESL